jgi:hypothetical protein
MRTTSRLTGYGDRLYAIREQQHSALVKVFSDLANEEDYARLALEALHQCKVHLRDDLRTASETAGDDKDLRKKMAQIAYNFYTRSTTILKVIASGNWAAIQGHGYHAMYSIGSKIVRPDRKRRSAGGGMTLARFKSVREGLMEATDYQLVEVLNLIAAKMARPDASHWERSIARALEGKLNKGVPRSILDHDPVTLVMPPLRIVERSEPERRAAMN